MKKFAFLSLFLLSSMACATINKAFDSTQTPTPFVVPTTVIEKTAVPTDITRKEDLDIYCPTDNADAMAAYNQGVTYENTGDETSAIKSYREAISLDPNYCDAMDNLAILLRKNGEAEEAISWYQASIAIAPDNEVSHLGLANAYMELEDYDKALAEYNALLDIDLNNPEGYYGAGRVYFAQEDYKEAIVQFKKAEEIYISIESNYLIDAQTYIGFSYVLLGDYENGRTYLELVYPDLQDNSYVNYYLGQCYYYGTSIRNEPLAKLYLTRARDLGIKLEPELEKFVNTP